MTYILEKNFNKKVHENVTEEKQTKYDTPVDFETAITAAGFGKFNILIAILCIPMCWSTIFETTVMSYVLPNAQCDLDLSLEDKGLINGVTYAGVISSAFLWGYLFDTLGRKKLLASGFLLIAIVDVFQSFSQNITYLMVLKFIGGFVMGGPFAGLTAYVSELHSATYRSRVPLMFGLWNALGNLYLPILAAIILPMKFKLIIAERFVLHSWGLYIFLTSLPAFLSGIAFVFLPESPKFLMSMGKNGEALTVLKKIYSVNTGNPPETYPVKELIEEVQDQTNAPKISFREGCNQLRPLFSVPFLNKFILICLMQSFMVSSLNSLRLWLPQIFQAINDYKFINGGTTSTLCEMLSVIQPSEQKKTCFVNTDNFEVYSNSMIVSTATACSYFIAGSLVNFLGQKRSLISVSFLSGLFATGIFFAPNDSIAVVCLAGFISLASVATNLILVIIVNLFPTTLRTMTVSLVMMFGRGAAMFGNILFPILLALGCGPPFFVAATWSFVSCLLTFLLPKENKNFI